MFSFLKKLFRPEKSKPTKSLHQLDAFVAGKVRTVEVLGVLGMRLHVKAFDDEGNPIQEAIASHQALDREQFIRILESRIGKQQFHWPDGTAANISDACP